ncbi:MAG: molecular chaperone HtpG [Erysipelotrichaceae bacterium]
MERKEFKAESKRLLDMMIHSIYTHPEIFLRELISNASDANDKLNYLSIQEGHNVDRSNLKIEIECDPEHRVLTIRDHGIGMSKEEMEENLGTIAKSGSLAFKQNLEQPSDDIDVIGQFGVGFYAAFMVAKRVEVTSKKVGTDTSYKWTSEVVDGYEIEEANLLQTGTTIRLFLKENTEDENFDQYVDANTIETLVKKYSDYIRYPIEMEKEITRSKADSDEVETVRETVVLNSMVPLWKKNKSEITKEDYKDFYTSKFHDFAEPARSIHMNIEGNVSFNALLFIPSKKPYNFYTQDFEKGLQLYSRGVFIMDKANDLLPEHFRFVKGLVDSQDLSLNISRELLQHDRQLKQIANRLEKKIKSELLSMLENERETYEAFWENFGLQLKFGVYNDFGANKELLQDLLLFYSSSEKKLVTLKEYVARMPEGQEAIYFASGENVDKIDRLPQSEKVKDKGFEILYLTDNVDEFAMQALMTYEEKPFKNINQGDLNLDSEEEKAALEEKAKENVDLLTAIKTALGDKVQDVRISSHLKSHPVCMVSGEGLSFEMEKVLAAMPDANMDMKAGRILEINADHAIFSALQQAYNKDQTQIDSYANLLFNQAMLIEGFTIEDPIAFSQAMCDLMIQANK